MSQPSILKPKSLKHSSFMNFEAWRALLDNSFLSVKNTTLVMKGLREHPEWVNQVDRFQETPLILASSLGHTEVVNTLIQAGAYLNFKTPSGVTALMRASSEGYLDIVKVFIQSGADLNLQNQSGWTALMYASHFGYSNVVQELIQEGVDINTQDRQKWTALMLAAHQGFLLVVQALMNHGADADLANNDQQTALDLAKQENQEMVVAYLNSFKTQQALSQTIKSMDSSSSVPSSEGQYHGLTLKNTRL